MDIKYKEDLLTQLTVLKAKIVLAASYEDWVSVGQQLAFMQEALWEEINNER